MRVGRRQWAGLGIKERSRPKLWCENTFKRKARNGERSENRFKRQREQLQMRCDALAPKQVSAMEPRQDGWEKVWEAEEESVSRKQEMKVGADSARQADGQRKVKQGHLEELARARGRGRGVPRTLPGVRVSARVVAASTRAQSRPAGRGRGARTSTRGGGGARLRPVTSGGAGGRGRSGGARGAERSAGGGGGGEAPGPRAAAGEGAVEPEREKQLIRFSLKREKMEVG